MEGGRGRRGEGERVIQSNAVNEVDSERGNGPSKGKGRRSGSEAGHDVHVVGAQRRSVKGGEAEFMRDLEAWCWCTCPGSYRFSEMRNDRALQRALVVVTAHESTRHVLHGGCLKCVVCACIVCVCV